MTILYTVRMSRPLQILSTVVLLAAPLSFSGCGTIYSDVYAPKRNHYKAPPEKVINTPATPTPTTASPAIPGPTAPPSMMAPPPAPAPAIPGADAAVPPTPAAPTTPAIPGI
jgi:hypothetical protein